jgi:hypothetical protein
LKLLTSQADSDIIYLIVASKIMPLWSSYKRFVSRLKKSIGATVTLNGLTVEQKW